jgi:hypothetical protein
MHTPEIRKGKNRVLMYDLDRLLEFLQRAVETSADEIPPSDLIHVRHISAPSSHDGSLSLIRFAAACVSFSHTIFLSGQFTNDYTSEQL